MHTQRPAGIRSRGTKKKVRFTVRFLDFLRLLCQPSRWLELPLTSFTLYLTDSQALGPGTWKEVQRQWQLQWRRQRGAEQLYKVFRALRWSHPLY